MRIALLTDIHGNREAFAAVLADLAARQVDRIAVLGDVVGYGPDPAWCVDRVMDLVGQGALCVKGNHDSAIATPLQSMTAIARAAIDWTRPQLTAGQAAFLAALPVTVMLDDVLFVHASANDPSGWIYVTSERSAMPSFRVSTAQVIFCGHVHVPALFTCDIRGTVRGHRIPMARPVPLLRSRRWLAVVGSVGQPRDGVAQAGYALFDTASRALTFRRVAYDCAATAAKLRAAGLPETLALRLLRGS
ncbi:MAG: metallophosphoesterase [Rhodobacter sp.]|nr:metallophosphoesterase [Rhodobacter sp.]MCA3492992.1 metallophosphoesterase [Rhodobacter sp.]MCA3498648.1 metallophosphoesterase [Rhodobacter sp.]MCA3501808.1 metallophosphoesterase [Rhodobacter sp.]MCA3517004.1 metallophosphoesterase [Rhodobacter sp.]